MKKLLLLLSWFLITFLFGACSASNATPSVLVTVRPTETKSVNPTSTVSLISTVDPLTPSAIAQFFHTLEATTATPEATSPPSYEECKQWDELTPDQNWALCNPMVDPITLINKSNQFWQFSYKEYYGKEILDHCTNLLYSTKDEEYLYFSLNADCIMADPGFVSSISVFRMNLINGEVGEILKASYDFASYSGNYYTESISPTGRRMAYITDQDHPLKLNLLDLKTGEIQSFPIEDKYIFGGAYTWSTDGIKLVYMLESGSNDEHFISMVFLDLLKDNSMVTFIKDKDFNWIAAKIDITDNGVKISPIDEEPLFYNIDSGVLSLISR